MSSVSQKVKEITQGWKNYLIPNPVTEIEASRRALICYPCDKRNKTLNVCSECGCPLQVKTRSTDSKCPHPNGNKW